MQHLEGSGTPVLYIGRAVLKGWTRIPYERSVYEENTPSTVFMSVSVSPGHPCQDSGSHSMHSVCFGIPNSKNISFSSTLCATVKVFGGMNIRFLSKLWYIFPATQLYHIPVNGICTASTPVSFHEQKIENWWTVGHGIWYWKVLIKYIGLFQFYLKSNQNNWHCTYRSTVIFAYISSVTW